MEMLKRFASSFKSTAVSSAEIQAIVLGRLPFEQSFCSKFSAPEESPQMSVAKPSLVNAFAVPSPTAITLPVKPFSKFLCAAKVAARGLPKNTASKATVETVGQSGSTAKAGKCSNVAFALLAE